MPTSKKLPPLPLAQGCACSPPPSSQHSRQLVDSRGWNIRYFIAITLLAALWWGAYSYILPTAKWLSYKLLGFAPGSHLGASVEFFLYDSVKILLLLVAMIYAIGWVRAESICSTSIVVSATSLDLVSEPSLRFVHVPASPCFLALPTPASPSASPWPSLSPRR